MQQEVEYCAGAVTQEYGERHLCLSGLNDLQEETANFCVGNASFKTQQTYFLRFLPLFFFFPCYFAKTKQQQQMWFFCFVTFQKSFLL